MRDVSLRLHMQTENVKVPRRTSQKHTGIDKDTTIGIRLSTEDKKMISDAALKRGETVTVYLLQCVAMAQSIFDLMEKKEKEKKDGN